MSDTWADAQFDVLEAAYDEVPIWAKKRIAELERENAKLWRINENIGAELANFGEQRDKAIAELTVERDAYFEMVKRVLADCDACYELIRDLWKCLSAHIESAINDGGCGYPYSPQTRGCGEGCTVNGEDCSMSLIERRMRKLGIEVDE